MTHRINLDNISIFLVQPQIPENIGAVARAMNNMGLSRLVIVSPKNYDHQRVLKMATRGSVNVVDALEFHEDLKEALGPYGYVVGTTARSGSHRPVQSQPHSLAEDLIAISQNNRIAIMFGPEDRGLSNSQLNYCHNIVNIPTAHFSSINLAQAVMIICYEIFLAARDTKPKPSPRLANEFELEGMYEHLKDVLMKIGFINPQNPEHWMFNLRRFMSRLPLRAREVLVIRGICRQIDWYSDQLEKIRKKSD
ncbi:MAG: RNA methyltransferase [Deltaproteobacteria bacterium]|nr:RNA methyltransferase [Deltaproteobacteria bacterium]